MGIEQPLPEKGGEKNDLRGQVVKKQETFVALENLADHDIYYDVVLARAAGGTRFVNESFEFKSREVDMDYKQFLSSILTLDENFEPTKKQKGMNSHVIGNNSDCYNEEEIDPHYELFLKKLKEHEKSYVFRFEGAGSPGFIKYEREISSDEECDSDYNRRLRSDTNQDYGIQNQMPHIENRSKHLKKSTSIEMNMNLTPRKLKKEVKNRKVEAGKHSAREMLGVLKYEREISSDEECDSGPNWRLRSDTKQDYGIRNQMPHIENQHIHLKRSTSVEMNMKLAPRKSKKEVKNQKVEAGKRPISEMRPDLDYLTLLQSSKFVDDYFLCTSGSATIVYEKNDMENNQKKENSEDEHSSDVEILDITSPEVIKHMHEGISPNLSGQTTQSRFRKELVAVLRKPYDKVEHRKLLQDIKIRKPEDRHRDLRGGREMSCSTAKVGKSYIDRFPGLRKQLLTFQDDRPKCLNLLRGFFFWLQKCPQEESFESWMDAECLAISPEVRHPQFSPKKRRKI